MAVGRGQRLFEDTPTQPLRLVSQETLGTGVLNLAYAPADAPADGWRHVERRFSVRRQDAWSGGGLEELEVELDFHHVAERDHTDTGRQHDIDAEILAANLGRGLEAGMTRAAREGLDAAKLDGEHDGTGDVADGQLAVDLILGACTGDASRAEHHGRTLGDVDEVRREDV